MKKLFITTAMASMLCMGFVSCADELNIKSIDPQSSPTYTAEGLLAKQYATLGLTGQKGPAGSADLSGDEGESGFIRTVFNLQELMTDEILWAWQDNEGIAAITNMNWDKSNARVNWAYQRLIFDITLYNQFISEQTGKMSEDKIAEVRFLRALNYYYFLDLYRKAPFKETFDSNLPIEKSGKDLYEWLDNELTTIEPMMAEVGAYNNSENFVQCQFYQTLVNVCITECFIGIFVNLEVTVIKFMILHIRVVDFFLTKHSVYCLFYRLKQSCSESCKNRCSKCGCLFDIQSRTGLAIHICLNLAPYRAFCSAAV